MAGYSFISWAALEAALLQRLQDTAGVFTSPAEAAIYLTEALRVLNAQTAAGTSGQWSVDYLFDFNPGDTWKSLNVAGSPRERTVTDEDIQIQMQYMLMEPPSGLTWAGTSQFNTANLEQALQFRRDELLQMTGANTVNLLLVSPTNSQRTLLPDSSLDLRRVRWGPGAAPPAFGPVLEQDFTSNNQPQFSDFFGLNPVNPSRGVWSIGPGVVFGDFDITQPDTKLFLTFYDSSYTPLLAVDLSTVGATVIAPASTALFMLSADGVTPGETYVALWSIAAEVGYSYTVVPNGDNYETDISTPNSDTAILMHPISTLGPQGMVEVIGYEGDFANPFFINFLDAGFGILSSFAAIVGTYTAPNLTAYWSLTVEGEVPVNDGAPISLEVTQAIGGSGFGLGSYALGRDDVTSADAYGERLSIQPGSPDSWRITSNSPLSFDVSCPPNQPGMWDTLILFAEDAFTPPSASVLGLPDDWCWVAMYGALADALANSPEATDVQRAKYCRMRYERGMKAMMTLPWLLDASVANLPVGTPSYKAMDAWAQNWELTWPEDDPQIVVGGMDFVALAPNNNSQATVSSVLTVVGSAPVDQSIPVQLSRDAVEAVLAYAQHVASFKRGGAEFLATMPLFEQFEQYCTAQNRRYAALGIFRADMLQEGDRADDLDPRFGPPKKGAAK